MTDRRTIIRSVGAYLPARVMTNDDLSKIVDTSDEWIVTRTGMKERRISHVSATELSTVAAARAIACAGLEPNDIDLIARRGELVAFVEVKSRRGVACGTPLEAIPKRKQSIIGRVAAIWALVALAAVVLVGPALLPFSYEETDWDNISAGPSLATWHLFGTDSLGRDLLVRTAERFSRAG